MIELYKNVYNKSFDDLIKRLDNSLKKKQKEFIITANAEIFMKSSNDSIIKDMLLDQNNIVTADGISIVKTAKYFDLNIANKITGVDICSKLLEIAAKKKYSVFVYGSKQEVLDLLKEKYNDVNFVALNNGYDSDKEKVKKDIIKMQPDIVIVALGVPGQELFISSFYGKIKNGICIGVGGSLDVLSGSKKRAPKLFIKTNTEWLYRIVCEPKRIKRFYDNNVKLLKLAKKAAKKEVKNEN